MLISGYTSPWDLLLEELNQRKEEGFLIPAELTAEFDGLDPEKDAWNEAAIAQHKGGTGLPDPHVNSQLNKILLRSHDVDHVNPLSSGIAGEESDLILQLL